MIRRAVRDTATMFRRLPLTEAGWAVVVGTIVTFLMAWLLGWFELGIVATGGLLALAVGLVFVLRRYRLDIERTIEPSKVTVGDPSFGLLHVTNPRSSPSLALHVEDKVGNAIVPVDLPALGPRKSHEALYQLPTDRRGVLDVGPVSIGRSDPLRLFRSEVSHSDVDRLWIRPRYQVLRPLPSGFAKDFEGPTSETSPKGDVTFHALREYVFGDDYRHIHWRSSARLGTLMVRQYVDNRLPQTTIVIDPSTQSYDSGDCYELGVSVAASIGVSSMLAKHPVVLFHGEQLISGAPLGGGIESVLDSLCLIDHEDRDMGPLTLAAVLQRIAGSSVVVYITGSLTSEELLRRTSQAVGKARVVVVRARRGDDARPAFVPRVKLIDADNLDQFRASWNQIAS